MHRAEKNNDGIANGAIVTVVFHVAILFVLFALTLSYSSKTEINRNEKKFIAVEFEQPQKIIPMSKNAVERGKNVGKATEQSPQNIKISDKTRTPKANDKPNTKALTAGSDGDIGRYEKPQPKINEKALYQSTTDGGETDNERSKIKDNGLFVGSSHNDEPARSVNAQSGPSVSSKGVSFSLDGRSVNGGFPKPTYNIQKSGRVVVEITVDQNGKVTKARATAKGSTLQDATLWESAENAALKTVFNIDKNAAIFQRGTITYIFSLN